MSGIQTCGAAPAQRRRLLLRLLYCGVFLFAGCTGEPDDNKPAGSRSVQAQVTVANRSPTPIPTRSITAAGTADCSGGDQATVGKDEQNRGPAAVSDDKSRESLEKRSVELARKSAELANAEDFAAARAPLDERLAILLRLNAPSSYQVRECRSSIDFLDWIIALSDDGMKLYRKSIELQRAASEESNQGHFRRALELARSAQSICKGLHGGGTIGDVALTEFIGNQYGLANDFPRARDCFREAVEVVGRTVGEVSPRSVILRIDLARMDVESGDFVHAIRMYEQARDESNKLSKDDQRCGCIPVAVIGALYFEMGDTKTGERMLNEAAASARTPDGEPDQITVAIATALAECYVRTARYADAEPLLVQAVQFYDSAPWLGNPQRFDARASLGRLYSQMGRNGQAEPILTRILTESRELFPDDGQFAWKASQYLGELYVAKKDYSAAGPLLAEAVKSKEEAIGEDNPWLRSPLQSYEQFLVAVGRTKDAEAVARRITKIDQSVAAMRDELQRR